MKIIKLLRVKFPLEYITVFKEDGFKGVLRKGGLKILFYFFIFYFKRDSILYILIPYLVIKGFFF
tara:strand:- start:355 stop:549 length:195 start_codon:yes stop_codon:yes gene_type:complete